MAGISRKGGKKGRKIGRNENKCKKYLTERRRIRNKTRKLNKSIKNIHPDTQKHIIKTNKIGRKKETR